MRHVIIRGNKHARAGQLRGHDGYVAIAGSLTVEVCEMSSGRLVYGNYELPDVKDVYLLAHQFILLQRTQITLTSPDWKKETNPYALWARTNGRQVVFANTDTCYIYDFTPS